MYQQFLSEIPNENSELAVYFCWSLNEKLSFKRFHGLISQGVTGIDDYGNLLINTLLIVHNGGI